MQVLLTMNIHSPKGTKVRPIYENGKPKNGWDAEKDLVRRFLEPDGIYTVDHTVVSDWSTAVWLKEVPGVVFNSVMLEEV